MSSINYSTLNPLLISDFYKIDHRSQYPKNTTKVYSNFTPRSSINKTEKSIIFFGLEGFIKSYLIEKFNKDFFSKDINSITEEFKYFIEHTLLIKDFDTSHIEALHKLGYLPLKIKALPEKSLVNLKVPCLTITNTHPDFAWVVNFVETILSAKLWITCTSATTAYKIRNVLESYADKTLEENDKWFIDYQAHDFSMRGMAGLEAATLSGTGHLAFFKGTDTIPAIAHMKEYYNKDITNGNIGGSVPATEHSVMCAGGRENEYETYKRLITEVYPSGIASIVSDTWDLWNVLTNILPRLKEEILNRNGKVVIRPDSGDPVDIVCGNGSDGSPEGKGVIELLWEVFGGTVNSKGYKVLHPSIGCIYGDGITIDRANQILEKLEKKGFASNCIVFGVGSYTYQYVTRDVYGFAMKATYCEIDGKSRDIFKDPITKGNVNKKSAKGLLQVQKDVDGNYILKDQCTKEEEKLGELKTVFLDGNFINS